MQIEEAAAILAKMRLKKSWQTFVLCLRPNSNEGQQTLRHE
jgi:hypothetical protein